MNARKHILLFCILTSINFSLSAWTSSNEGVCYNMDTLCLLSDSISYNQNYQRYEVACDVIILENDTLRINPGQYLYFIMVIQPPIIWEYYGIRIFGTFLAIGNSNNQITLGDPEYNISNGNVWMGIQFYNTSQNGESILMYCIVRGALCLNDCGYGSESAIYCENSSPVIDHCNICYMISDQETGGGSAIACKGESYPIVSYCKFEYLINSVAIWCNPWGDVLDTIDYPSPLILGCNIMPTVQGFYFFPPIWNDVVIFRGGFIDNCYLGINSYSADTTLGIPIDTIGDGVCNTASTNGFKRFMDVDGVVNPRGDTLLTGIDEEEVDILPTTSKYLILNNCYPNPFDNYTSIKFELKKHSLEVALFLFDTKGNRIKTLIKNQPFNVGEHKIKWYGDNDFGQKMPEGIYFYKLMAGNNLLVKKAIVVK